MTAAWLLVAGACALAAPFVAWSLTRDNFWERRR